MALGSNLAGVARVAFEAQTAGFYAELRQVEARYEATLARMQAAGARMARMPTTLPGAATSVGGVAGTSSRAPVYGQSTTPGAERARARRRAMGIGPRAVGGEGVAAVSGAADSMSKYTTEANKATGATKAYGAAANSATSSSTKMAGGIVKSTLAFAGVVGALSSIRAISSQLAEAERVTAQTAAVIESTGGIAGVTADHIDELSLAYQKNSLFTDEQVQSGLNMLLTFKNIRNVTGENNDIFDQSSQVLVDMGAAFNRMTGGSDGLMRSSIILGKALNDPIKGITALTRYGVTFTAQEREQIKTMAENGNVMGAQQKILAELTSEFGGSGKAGAETFTGQIIVMKHELLESAEAMAGDLVPALTIGLKLFQGLLRILGPIKPIIIALAAAWALWKIQILIVNSAFLMFIPRVIAATAVLIVQNGVLATLRFAWAALTAVMLANPIGIIIAALAILAGALYIAWQKSNTFREIVTKVFQVVATAVAKWIGLIVRYIDLWLGALSSLFDAVSWIPGIGDKFKQASTGINAARDGLKSMVQWLEHAAKKDWNVQVNVHTDYTQSGEMPPHLAGLKGPVGVPEGAKPPGGGKTKTTTEATGDWLDIPQNLQTRESIAARRGEDENLLQIYEEQTAWLKRKLRRTNLTLAERAKLNDQLASVNGKIQSIHDGEAQAADEFASSQQDAAQAAADARAKSFETPGRIQAGQAAAGLSEKWLGDDEKWYKAELQFLRKKRRMVDLSYAEKKDLDTRIKAAEDKMREIDAERARRRKEVQDARRERDQLLIENAMARAELTPKISDNLNVLGREERMIRARLAVLKKKVDLSNEELKEQTDLLTRLKQIRDDKKALLEQEAEDEKSSQEAFDKMAFDLLGQLHGIGNQWGSNIADQSAGLGALETQAHVQTALLREQNVLIEDLTGTASHPNARYSQTELMASTTGYGF